ncbi:alpha/beta-hydrolase [Podospora conica]|nr:alpha/beta-hydrolase [Schizothecium conicum]
MPLHSLLLALLATATLCTSQPLSPPLTVPLPYAHYTGVRTTLPPSGSASANLTLTTWKGIRYAAPPTGILRWQRPRPPTTPATGTPPTVQATTPGPTCPQAMPAIPGLGFIPGDEDCLFLNVWVASPSMPPGGAAGLLPVLVVVHGGGYGLGGATTDMTSFLAGGGAGMVVVEVQYRLGAFGFLASPEVKRRGVVNAGLLDQRLALEWVQMYIVLFGGDKGRVTVAGESAGAGSGMLHALAPGGGGGGLFGGVIAASPWVPGQPRYDDGVAVRRYEDFAALAGCGSGMGGDGDVFGCLVGRDSLTLQWAGNAVSMGAATPRGNWAFIPVTDDEYVLGPPSEQLARAELKGLRLLVGNNANEGTLIPPSNILTEADLVAWIKSNFANLSPQNITALLAAYPSDSGPVRASTPRFETSGYGPATAVNISQPPLHSISSPGSDANTPQKNMYAEASVICPAYWLASAFARNGLPAYYYQYSVPFAVHGADLAAVWGPPGDNLGPDLVTAFQKLYTNFITTNNPSLAPLDANGRSSPDPAAPNPATAWPPWTGANPVLLNINQTGGRGYTAYTASGVGVTQFRGPGLRNRMALAEAYAWEGGRGGRCEVWRGLGGVVPL